MSHSTAIYQRPAEILQNLIRFDTTNPPGNEILCINYLNDLLTQAGFETQILAKEPSRANLVTRLKGQGSAPPLLLQGHVDVVTTANQQWTHPPFEGKLRELLPLRLPQATYWWWWWWTVIGGGKLPSLCRISGGAAQNSSNSSISHLHIVQY